MKSKLERGRRGNMGKNTSLNTGNLTNENKKKICEKKLENPDIRQSDLAEWAKRELPWPSHQRKGRYPTF